MSLLFWMPMTTDDLINQGLSNAIPVNKGTTISQNGKLGKCRYFDGNVNGIDTGFKESFGTGDFSITAWFYLVKNTSKSYQPIITNKSTGAASVGCGIYFNKSQMKFLWSTADGSGATEVWMSTALTEDFIYDKWHHIVMVRDSNDSKKGCFYIDGVRYELASIPSIRNVTNTSVNFCIGGMPSDYASYRWSGSMNDVRIYDHALSPREVKEISKGLVLHYTLSNGGGDNIIAGSSPNEITYTYPSSSYSDKYAPITTIIPTASKYTLSFFAKSTVNGDVIRTHFYSPNTTTTCVSSQGITKTASDGNMDFTLSTEWKRYWVVYTQTETTAVKHVICPRMGSKKDRPTMSGTGTVSIKCVKLEEGDHPTPWVPNSSDVLYTQMGLNNNIEYDVSGFCNNGTKVGTLTYSTDTPKYWTSSCFNKSQYIKSSNEINTDNSTISLWIKADLSAGYHILDCRNNTGTGKQPIYTYANGSIQCGGNNQYVTSNAGLLVNDTWIHVVIVQNENILSIYKNGSLFQTLNCVNSPIISPVIGARYTYANLFKGQLSDFRIYATALSADDIKELYNTPISLTSNGVLMTSGELTEA